jgi:HPt (histidine-containing phosphotransfer) domain-containing protein
MVNALTNAHLMSMMQGNTSLVEDLVVHFVHHTPQLIDRFEVSLNAGDWNALFGATQRLMSSFRLLQETEAIDSLNALSEERVHAMTAVERRQLCMRLRAMVEAFA